jgi:U4/U6.U5 tri-snRNP-associated protein 1
MSSEIIELSVEETNKLRAELGLAPLRVDTDQQTNAAGGQQEGASEELLELSVAETNNLRERLGLAPLKTDATVVQHAPATNELEVKQTAERIERVRLKRQVQDGIQTKFAAQSLGAESTSDAKSWAQQMRTKQTTDKTKVTAKRAHEEQAAYDETDLKGLNVGHSLAELQEGSTTVLTLADAPLLKTREDISNKVMGLNDDDVHLENVNLAEERLVQDGLREKRKVELGMGRAGGYAGFDDDEFEELGGTQAPSRFARTAMEDTKGKTKTKQKGFQIGAMLEEQDAALESDLFAIHEGRAISLEPAHADVAASDFMTVEEDAALKQAKKKAGKFKKEKKEKRKTRTSKRRTDDEEEEQEDAPKKGLLEQLEETAVESKVSRKCRRANVVDEVVETNDKEDGGPMEIDQKPSEAENLMSKRSKYDAVMAKGNERSQQAFGNKKKLVSTDMMDEEPDDAFLNAALAKARRLNRLKEMSEASKQKKSGADAVVAAVQQSNAAASTDVAAAGTITFAVDETREFTRALLARTEQAERELARKKAVKKEPMTDNADTMEIAEKVKSDVNTAVKEEIAEEEVDIHELAKQVKEDDNDVGLDGATGNTVPMGRGVGGILNLLKQTGEITRKNAGKEEMRGRAKDKRTYEDYEPLDLSKVVKIDESKANSKDKEFANREIKLEYRDKHGRLLTRKEAFRDLSYQFHGYGSGKRKEEKKLDQIAREQAEARLASRQAAEGAGAGTFGALKATQKATGKAFVVHKTGN